MQSFAELKKNRQSSLSALSSELEKINSKTSTQEEDARFWNITRDKSGNGSAVIRFLPAPKGEDVPFVRYFRHSFQGPNGRWFIHNCPTSIGKPCPVCEHNRELWNSGLKSNQELVSKQKRRLVIVSNILVIKDPANPENEGTVKLFKYGKKIYDKLNDLMNPAFPDDPKINPFDLWEGANFKLIVKTVDKFPNYDKSTFDAVSPVSKDEDELERIWSSEYSLTEFLDEKLFKNADELKAQLDRVLGLGAVAPTNVSETVEPKVGKTAKAETPPFADDDDIDSDFFKKIAAD